MTCQCCGTPLTNSVDTFGDVGQEMCWQCWSGLWGDRIWKWPLTDGAITKAVEASADVAKQNAQRWLNEVTILQSKKAT